MRDFIIYSLTHSDVEIWYIDDKHYLQGTKALVQSLDRSFGIFDGMEVASEEDLSDIISDIPFPFNFDLVEEDFKTDASFYFDAIVSENDKPLVYLIYRSEVEAYEESLLDDYDSYLQAQNNNDYDEMYAYWSSQRI